MNENGFGGIKNLAHGGSNMKSITGLGVVKTLAN
jgi:hypothetical protein